MKISSTRRIVMTAILSAVSAVLMFLNFTLPFVPSYLKIDFSEFPALLASFSLGPLSGAAVCFVKNFINVFSSSTGGVGELSNFILGVLFTVPAGIYYSKHRNLKGAVVAAVLGMAFMTVASFFTNKFLVYPAYTLIMPVEAIVGMSSAIIPSIDSVTKVILIFNVPFTAVKGLLNVLITFLLYKRISPILQGRR